MRGASHRWLAEWSMGERKCVGVAPTFNGFWFARHRLHAILIIIANSGCSRAIYTALKTLSCGGRSSEKTNDLILLVFSRRRLKAMAFVRLFVIVVVAPRQEMALELVEDVLNPCLRSYEYSCNCRTANCHRCHGRQRDSPHKKRTQQKERDIEYPTPLHHNNNGEKQNGNGCWLLPSGDIDVVVIIRWLCPYDCSHAHGMRSSASANSI